jgi:hypothetical protein
MTSNGNKAQKIIIKEYAEISNDYINETVFYLAHKNAQNNEQKQIIKNIAKKFNITL